ncbi:hypothetical protein VDG1235_4514 [Verrucomicrobiia bacterium DG1235]|nr:hypothetical protein VDG1235_4514 [Verrucomicrobiae bacterium DG1235]
MKLPLSLALLCLLTPAVHSQQKAILGPNEYIELDTPKTEYAEKRALIESLNEHFSKNIPFESQMPLEHPPEWGKTVSPESTGSIHFMRSFPQAFVGHLSIEGLAPNHPYRLTLNGNPERKGNDLLPTPVPWLPDERFYDFLDITTDDLGSYESTLGIRLTAGEYDVRIYVKDTEDWKIVLYRDFFEFTVE